MDPIDVTAYRPDALPPTVTAYLDARDDQRHADAAALFTEDAVVVDDGQTHAGAGEVGAWTSRTSTEFTYTTTRIGQQVVDAEHATVVVRIDGDFPGGTATLAQHFELAGDLVSRLVIEPVGT